MSLAVNRACVGGYNAPGIREELITYGDDRMSGPLHVYYGPEIQLYYFGPAHPFNQRRVELSVDLMAACGLFESNGNTLGPIDQATIEDAQLFHKPQYLDLLRRASERGVGYLDRGDTPAFPGCLDAALWAVGSTLAALEAVLGGEGHAFSVGGGHHHAHPESASGFCIMNDASIALQVARQRYGIEKALYLDIDVHHGDGIFYGFYAAPWLLDIDFHQYGYGFYPGTGDTAEVGAREAAGVKLNVPLAAGAADDSAMLAWREVAVPAIRAFRPELIVMQCGADAHSGDPLASLEWSTGPYCEIARSVHELAHEVSDGRLLLLGGGGYNPGNVCAAWAAIALTVGDVPLPEILPQGWCERFEETYGQPAPTSFREPATASSRVLRATQRSIGELRELSPLLADAGKHPRG